MRSTQRFRDDLEAGIEDQIAALRREVAALSKTVSRRSAGALDDAQDAASELIDQLKNLLRQAMPVAQRKADAAEKLVRRHPTAAAATVGLVVAGLALSLMLSRRK